MDKATGSEGPAYPAEKARQGEIILTSRPRRLIFIAGLVIAFVIALILVLALR